MHATTYLLAALAAIPAFAAPNPSPVEEKDVASPTVSLSGAQVSPFHYPPTTSPNHDN